MILQNMFR